MDRALEKGTSLERPSDQSLESLGACWALFTPGRASCGANNSHVTQKTRELRSCSNERPDLSFFLFFPPLSEMEKKHEQSNKVSGGTARNTFAPQALTSFKMARESIPRGCLAACFVFDTCFVFFFPGSFKRSAICRFRFAARSSLFLLHCGVSYAKVDVTEGDGKP